MQVTVSKDFRQMTVRAIMAIAFFMLTYLLLIVLAVGLTLLCGFAGVMLIIAKPAFLTLMIGLGLISMGILVLLFLFKFIFRKHKVDRSHLMEVTQEQEPKLFAFIAEIVQEVKTEFPKKVYLSSDVNASVFYDSNFWSMFLPIRKNLQIGMGLVNTVSEDEFKAILAHEFGHFSQRSMKVGSFVYNVNQVIYNMLYENDSYTSLAQKWADISGYFAFFAALALRIVQSVQWVLKKVYNVVNISYMSLSREMEFHADEVAANVAGSKPLITSLLRLDLADNAMNAVFGYYSDQIKHAVKSQNLYPQQQFVMHLLAQESNLHLEHNLPQVDVKHLSRYNKSKLVIKNQWASHPSTEDRVEKLQALNICKAGNGTALATTLFVNPEDVQAKVTEHLFAEVSYEAPPTLQTMEQFEMEFLSQRRSIAFDDAYNKYYDNRNILPFEVETVPAETEAPAQSMQTLYSDEVVDLVYTNIALESDISTLEAIANGEFKVKTFDYDGTRYTSRESGDLVQKLKQELQTGKAILQRHDLAIYRYFLSLAERQGAAQELKDCYSAFFAFDTEYDRKAVVLANMINASGFMNRTTPFKQIEQNLISLKQIEREFKDEVRGMLQEEVHQAELTPEISTGLTAYLSEDLTYFREPDYVDDALTQLFTSINNYQLVLNNTFFRLKKNILDKQVALEQKKEVPEVSVLHP